MINSRRRKIEISGKINFIFADDLNRYLEDIQIDCYLLNIYSQKSKSI